MESGIKIFTMADKLDLRPIIETKEFENSTVEERFQTQTLRPVLKLQNELLQMELF